jgi:RNA polymerase sigma-70 factor (ECF subfamily)
VPHALELKSHGVPAAHVQLVPPPEQLGGTAMPASPLPPGPPTVVLLPLHATTPAIVQAAVAGAAPRSKSIQPIDVLPSLGTSVRARAATVTSIFVVTFAHGRATNGDVGTVSTLRATGDLELAKRCCAGERAAQRDLFQREKRRVHATLYRILGSNTEMEDLVQEAFVEIFKGLSGYRGEASLGTWVDRITVRVAYAHIARRKAAPVVLAVVPDVPAGDASAEERAMSREAARRLYAVLDRLEARQRIAYVLHVIEGRPIADVARVMDASNVLTKVRVWRATRFVNARALRDALLEEFVTAGDAAETGRVAR